MNKLARCGLGMDKLHKTLRALMQSFDFLWFWCDILLSPFAWIAGRLLHIHSHSLVSFSWHGYTRLFIYRNPPLPSPYVLELQ